MATDKLWTKQITLFYAGESNPVTIPGLLNSDSSLEVFETTGIAVTVQDAAAGTINFTTPPPSFTNITLIAGQDVDWADGSGTPNITDHPISELEVDIALAGAQTAEANEGRLDNVEATIGDSSAGLVKDVADNAAANTAQDQAISDNAAAATANAQAFADLFDVDGKIKPQYLPQATASGLPTDFFTNDGKIKESYNTATVMGVIGDFSTRLNNSFQWAFTVNNFKNKTVDLAPANSSPKWLPNIVKNIEMHVSDSQDHLYFRFKPGKGMANKQSYVWSKPNSEGVGSWHKKFTMKDSDGWLPKGKGAGGVPFSYGGFNDGALNPRMKAQVQLLLEGSFFIDIRFDQHEDNDNCTISINAVRIMETI